MLMLARLHVKEKLRCLHLELTTLEKLDATRMVANACARQVQRVKELVSIQIMTDIGFTSIQMVSMMSLVDDTAPAF